VVIADLLTAAMVLQSVALAVAGREVLRSARELRSRTDSSLNRPKQH
jgi:hypothetical protein